MIGSANASTLLKVAYSRGFALVPLILVLLAWEFISDFNIVSKIFLPPPSSISAYLVKGFQTGEIPRNLLETLRRSLIGYSIASALAIPLGLLLGWKNFIYRIFEPIIEILRPIPGLAIIAPALLFFGIGDTFRAFVVAYACFFVILINCLYGVYAVDKLFLLSFKSMKATQTQVFTKLIVPGATPYVVAGLRQAIAVALIVVVGTEMIVGNSGMGFYLINSEQTFQYESMYAGIVVLGVVGYLLNKAFQMIEQRVLGWAKEITAQG